jgi:hypothetical protein
MIYKFSNTIEGIELEYSFTQNGKLINEAWLFNSMPEAFNYMQKLKKDWLFSSINKWILNKKFIIEQGQDQSNPTKLNALKRALDFLQILHDKPLLTLCNQIIKGQDTFKAILPSPNNTSYSSAIQSLESILTFCKSETGINKKAA